MEKIRNEIDRYLIELSTFGRTPQGGVTRFPFTQEAREASEYLAEQMRSLGLAVRFDTSGAVIGRLNGAKPDTIIIGSHYDTVENGGKYDGIAGVVCGLSIIRLIKEEYGNSFPYSIEVVATNDEEGARFSGGFFSSKAMLGLWTADELKKNKDAEGISIYDAMKAFGMEPDRLPESKRDLSKIRAFLEIHIEQGPILEKNNKEIGIVETIVGMRRKIVKIYGRADHAGTTPMDMRDDAMEKAAKIISQVGDMARNYLHSVATVGYIKAIPNAINTIAQYVEFSLDIRSAELDSLNALEKEIQDLITQSSSHYEIQETVHIDPVEMNHELVELLAKTAEDCGYSWMRLNSGAGHDSLITGPVMDTAMIFVPSKGGRSHCPQEDTDTGYFEKAVKLSYRAIRQLGIFS